VKILTSFARNGPLYLKLIFPGVSNANCTKNTTPLETPLLFPVVQCNHQFMRNQAEKERKINCKKRRNDVDGRLSSTDRSCKEGKCTPGR